MAMRAALGIGGRDRTSCSRLLSLTDQTSVGEMCPRAMSRAAKNPYWHGDQVTISRRLVDLAAEDKNN
jgi:hypothetical protein